MSATRRQSFGKPFRSCWCCAPASLPVTSPASPARRNFLAGGAAALSRGALALGGAAAATRMQPAAAQVAASKTRIDVHHHFVPPFHVDAMMAPGRRTGPPPPKWSPTLSLEDMDRSGIATAVLSVVQPGVWYGDNVEEARSLGRRLNEYGATMVKDRPAASGCSP
jgi:6-methylsalicylate decarboxylase